MTKAEALRLMPLVPRLPEFKTLLDEMAAALMPPEPPVSWSSQDGRYYAERYGI